MSYLKPSGDAITDRKRQNRAYDLHLQYVFGWSHGAGSKPMDPKRSGHPDAEMKTIYDNGYAAGQQVRREKHEASAKYYGVKQSPITGRQLSECPITWLPGLLQRLVRTCAAKNVFKDKEAFMAFVSKRFDLGAAGLAEMRPGSTISENREIAGAHFEAISGESKIVGKFLLSKGKQ